MAAYGGLRRQGARWTASSARARQWRSLPMSITRPRPTLTPRAAERFASITPPRSPRSHEPERRPLTLHAIRNRKSPVPSLSARHLVRLREPVLSPRRKEGSREECRRGVLFSPIGGSRPACSDVSTFRERGGSVCVSARRGSGLSRQTGRGDHRQTPSSAGVERQRPVIPPPAPVRRAIARCSSLARMVRSTPIGSCVIAPGVPLKNTAKRSSKR